jgi:flagellar protein FlbT
LVLTGDSNPEEDRLPMLRRIEELSQVFTDSDSRAALAEATESLLNDNHYRCLKALRALLPREERLMAIRPS